MTHQELQQEQSMRLAISGSHLVSAKDKECLHQALDLYFHDKALNKKAKYMRENIMSLTERDFERWRGIGNEMVDTRKQLLTLDLQIGDLFEHVTKHPLIDIQETHA